MKQKNLWSLLSSLLVLLLFAATSAEAQTATQAARQAREAGGQGYLFVAPGGDGNDGTLHLGGGGEGIFKNGASVGAELGYLGPMERLDNGLGVFSVNGGYHFKAASRSGKTVPFLTVGYTGFFRNGYANGINYGGGVNYWFNERVGLRIDFRDHVFLESNATHFLNARIGLTFR